MTDNKLLTTDTNSLLCSFFSHYSQQFLPLNKALKHKESVVKFLLLGLLLLPLYSHAKTKIIENFEYYKVAPTSKNDLLETLNSASPIREGGRVLHAHTKYNINWRFWWKSNSNSCVVTNVETTLTLTYTMPQLTSSNSDIKIIWSNWYRNLEIHEQGHAKLAKDIALKVDKKLLSIGTKTSCDILGKSGNKLANKLLADLKEASKKYDIRTNHGETQKAWLYMHL